MRICHFVGGSEARNYARGSIAVIIASIELAAEARSDLRFIAWGEILARAPEVTRASATPFRLPASVRAVNPDGHFGLEYRSEGKPTYRFFTLELDRGTMPVERSRKSQTSLLGKFDAYAEIIERQTHKSHLGIPNLLVLTVCPSRSRLETATSGLERCGKCPAFLFKAVEPELLTKPFPDMFWEPWQRAGLPPLAIGESR
jgi:hypothetical protein